MVYDFIVHILTVADGSTVSMPSKVLPSWGRQNVPIRDGVDARTGMT